MSPEPTTVTADVSQNAPDLRVQTTAGMTTKVVKGSIWTLAGQVLPLGISLFTTPFVIRLLGSEGYGVFILVVLIPSYFSFADLGMSIASTKFGSEAFGKNQAEKEAGIVRTSAFLALCTSVPIAASLIAFSSWIIGFFSLPSNFRDEASLALKIAAVTFVLNFLNGIFNTPQLARLRMDLNTLVTAGFRTLGIIATPIVVYLGYGVSGAVSVLLAASILTLAGHILISGKLLPNLYGLRIDRETLRPLLKFGGALAVAAIAAVFLVNLEKLVLARMMSVKALAYYSVAFTLATMLTMFTSSMTQSLVPAFSQLLGSESKEQLAALFSRSFRLNLFSILPLLAFLCAVATPFFTVFAGSEFGQESTPPFYILSLGLLFTLNAYISGSLLYAMGRGNLIAKLFWYELFPYIILTATLTFYFGIIGAAVSWSIRVIVESFILNSLACRHGGVKLRLTENLFSLVFGTVILLIPLLLSRIFGAFTFWLILGIPVSFCIYGVHIWRYVVAPDEKDWIVGRTRSLFA